MTVSCFQLHYTSLLCEFYKIYQSISGKAYDGQGLVRVACSGQSSNALTPAVAKYERQTPAGPSSLLPAGQSASSSWHPSIGAPHTMWIFGNALCHCPRKRWYGHVFCHCELCDDASPGDNRGLRCCDTQADS
ncbi:hypothetical protein MRX96_047359 [Rhipicephalus microplus]